ncbi:MAG: GNAT family N-acetyltransferase [Gammaproteobacteria bacterium]|nr:GNAT family N-acetyltransferase [Gammaproteobacteria bacterium]
MIEYHMTQEDAQYFADYFKKLGWHKPLSQLEAYIAEAQQGIRTNLVAKSNGLPVGYLTILWESDHLYFQERHIPEIKDLNVFPAERGKGFGKALLQAAEKYVFERSKTVGLGVGLTRDYAVAQILYVKQGYIPNGEGATSYHAPLEYGKTCQVDDDLVLWMVKHV